MIYIVLNIIYTFICYLGLSTSLFSLIYKGVDETFDYVVPQCVLGISWMSCLYLTDIYSFYLMILNLLMIISLMRYRYYYTNSFLNCGYMPQRSF